MTDTIIQFKFSDDVHMVGIYIKSDTQQEDFIPELYNIVKTCEFTNKKRDWSYVVAEIVSKITNNYGTLVKFILESQNEPSTVIYKYTITITEDIYKNDENKLIDFCKIKYISDTKPFDGLLKDFCQKIIKEQKQLENLINIEGITVKELKNWIKYLPDSDDETGEDFEVWINGTNCEYGLSNSCKSIVKLNKGDIILEI